MWIPTPIYERLPQFWLLLGLLFMASGVFLGFDYWLSFVYLAVGFGCCGWSAWILSLRISRRRPASADAECARTAGQPVDDRRKDPLPNV